MFTSSRITVPAATPRNGVGGPMSTPRKCGLGEVASDSQGRFWNYILLIHILDIWVSLHRWVRSGDGEHRKKWYRLTWESKSYRFAGVEGELADMKVLSAEGRRGSGREGIRQLWLWLDEWSCKFNLRLTKFCKTILLHVDVICSRLKLVTVFWILGYALFQETMTMPRKDFVTHPWVWNTLTYHWGEVCEVLQQKPCPPEMKSWNLCLGCRFSESYCKLMQIHGDFMEKMVAKHWIAAHTHTHADTPKMCF